MFIISEWLVYTYSFLRGDLKGTSCQQVLSDFQHILNFLIKKPHSIIIVNIITNDMMMTVDDIDYDDDDDDDGENDNDDL